MLERKAYSDVIWQVRRRMSDKPLTQQTALCFTGRYTRQSAPRGTHRQFTLTLPLTTDGPPEASAQV